MLTYTLLFYLQLQISKFVKHLKNKKLKTTTIVGYSLTKYIVLLQSQYKSQLFLSILAVR